MRLLLVPIFILGTATAAVAQKKTCDYSGQTYSVVPRFASVRASRPRILIGSMSMDT